jgi:hypothetical protein
MFLPPRKVEVRLPGKRNSTSHDARPVHPIITMIKWIRTSRLAIKNFISGPFLLGRWTDRALGVRDLGVGSCVLNQNVAQIRQSRPDSGLDSDHCPVRKSVRPCILVYVVYLVMYDSGWGTLRHLLVVCPSPYQAVPSSRGRRTDRALGFEAGSSLGSEAGSYSRLVDLCSTLNSWLESSTISKKITCKDHAV